MAEKRLPHRLSRGLALHRMQLGFNLIELMVGLAIFSMVLFMVIPSLGAWMQSSQIRSAAESISGGLQSARAEAVRRNTNVEFVLTSLVGGGTATNWVIRCDAAHASPTCPGVNQPVSGQALPDGQPGSAIEQRLASEGSPNATVSVNPAGTTTITFNGTGRITPLPAANTLIDVVHVSNTPTTKTCVVDGGPYRCLRLVVAPGGQSRMCDPSLVAPNPRACP